MSRNRQARESLDDDALQSEEHASDVGGSSPSKIAAVIENRAKEVGMAFFDGNEATLTLTQFAGGSSHKHHAIACSASLIVVNNRHQL